MNYAKAMQATTETYEATENGQGFKSMATETVSMRSSMTLSNAGPAQAPKQKI